MRRIVLVLLLVGVAGCVTSVGNPGPDTTVSGPPDTSWTAGDRINATRLARQHFARLRDHGSFVRNHTDRITVEGESRPKGYYPPSYSYVEVNLETGRYLGVFWTKGERRETTFVTPDIRTSRRKPCTSNTCKYDYSYQTRPPGDSRSERIARYRTERIVNSLADRLARWNFRYTETVRREGDVLYRYTANETLSRPIPITDSPPRGSATLLVTEHGVIRRFTVQYVGTATVQTATGNNTVTVRQTITVKYVRVGETTVERPDWIEQARTADPPRTPVTVGRTGTPRQRIQSAVSSSSRTKSSTYPLAYVTNTER